MTSKLAQAAAAYVRKYGLAVVKIPPGKKFPQHEAWNQPGGWFADPDEAAAFYERHPEWNIGAVLAPSRLCSLDIDHLEHSRIVFGELGVDLDELRAAHPTVQGNPARFRILFRVPDGLELTLKKLSWPDEHGECLANGKLKEHVVFELRAGLVQDVLPPSIHPDTRQPYQWLTRPNGHIPDLPEGILRAIWREWSIFEPDAARMCPWAPKAAPAPVRQKPARAKAATEPGDSVIDAFNAAHDIEDMLEACGYKRCGRRYLSPHSQTGLPGVHIGRDGNNRAMIYHGSDPLCSKAHEPERPVSPFDLFCEYRHGRDVKAAVKAAAAELGMSRARATAPAAKGKRQASAPKAAAPAVDARAPTETPPEAAEPSPPPPSSAGAAVPAGGGEGDGGNFSAAAFRFMLDNFTLIYGTKTVWDASRRLILGVDAMNTAYPGITKWWKEQPGRKMVDASRVVFEPGKTVHDGINLFDRLPLEPKQGRCDKILGLLEMLCGGDRVVVDFILRWLAYQMRHVGAKMATSIIMHGDEGSGKNLFWEEIVARLYGEYATAIGQDQLDTPYNGWASRKLLVIADEVVTRNELRHHKGRLKRYVTGKTVQVNEKHLPTREEGNYMNFAYLSNETVPLALDESDRRYLVVWTPPAQSREFYLDVVAEMQAGGVEAFYWHLLYNVPLDWEVVRPDGAKEAVPFDGHTKPPMTQAKDNLIELSMNSALLFWREWSRDGLGLPCMPCLAMDLYNAYETWCARTGEKYPMRYRHFRGELERKCECRVAWYILPGHDPGSRKQATCFLPLPHLRPADLSDERWVGLGISAFKAELKDFCASWARVDGSL